MSGDRARPSSAPPTAPEPATKVPTLVLWVVPFLLVLTYVFVVARFFHAEARWTGVKWIEVTELLVVATAVFSIAWYVIAYLFALIFGEYVPFGVLSLVTKIPGLHRHVIVSAPQRPDTAREVWGRFAILLLINLGFELIFMLLVVKRGDLAPRLAIGAPFRFLIDEFLAGLGLAILIAPAAPFLASRVRTRITDSLEFPLLWLAVLLLAVGGASVVEYEVLPGVVFNPALFFTSILLYAPAAWYVSLAFSRTESQAQNLFLMRAWRSRGGKFHFGRLKVTDEPEGSITEV